MNYKYALKEEVWKRDDELERIREDDPERFLKLLTK